MATIDFNYSFFDKIGLEYEKAYGHNQSLKEFIERVDALLPPKSKILDAGCGTGKPVAATLAARGHDVYGIDASEAMVRLSREQVPQGTFEQANMLQWEPAEPAIDCIFAIFAFFTMSRQQQEAMVEKFSKWVSPGGLLVLAVMTADNNPLTEPEQYDADGLCANGVQNPFMGETVLVSLFTKEGVQKLAQQNGFEIVNETQETFQAPAEAACGGSKPYYYLVARRKEE